MTKSLKPHTLSTFVNFLNLLGHLNKVVNIDVYLVNYQLLIALNSEKVLDVSQEVVDSVDVAVGYEAKVYFVADSVEKDWVNDAHSAQHVPPPHAFFVECI